MEGGGVVVVVFVGVGVGVGRVVVVVWMRPGLKGVVVVALVVVEVMVVGLVKGWVKRVVVGVRGR